MVRALSRNDKTLRSLDFTTNCPKRRAGNPCPYCYVEAARSVGCRAKRVYDRLDCDGEILRLRRPTIDRLNAGGGLRVFSFGDYMEWMDELIMRVVEDARAVGLRLKAITKQPLFVHKWFRSFAIINVSVDSIGHGVPHTLASELRAEYPNVAVRAAVLSPEDVDELSWADVLTLNHGPNGFHHFTKHEKEELAGRFPDKLCCITGKCETCRVKCGLGRVRRRAPETA